MRKKYCDICGKFIQDTIPYGSWYKHIQYTVEINSNVYAGFSDIKDVCENCISKIKDVFKK